MQLSSIQKYPDAVNSRSFLAASTAPPSMMTTDATMPVVTTALWKYLHAAPSA